MNTPYLEPCPHCGLTTSLMIAASTEMGYNDDNAIECYAVVCNVNRHGCGATGGYQPTITAAVSAWNTRPATEITWRNITDNLLSLLRRTIRIIKAS